MRRSVGYIDAVRILGGADSQLLTVLDRLAGGALIAGSALGYPFLLGLLDARSEVARLGQELVRGAGERRRGLSRSARTHRLQAAMEVLVVTAFFEVLGEAELPFRFGELALTTADQERLAGSSDVLVPDAASAGTLGPLLGPSEAPTLDFFHAGPQARRRLLDRYQESAAALGRFVPGLSVWDGLDETARSRFCDVLRILPELAADRYLELFRRLAGDVAEVAVWADQLAHGRTQEELAELRREMRSGLAGLMRLGGAASGEAVAHEQRAGLARAYHAALDRPIVEAGDLPEGMALPTLGEAYVAPAFRASPVGAQSFRSGRDRLSDETWWADVPVQEDLEGFLGRYLTSPSASGAPLLVLGQPGSGKSVLTRMLAARLPAAEFLTVRVQLRDVYASSEIQDQIEQGLRAATGERIEWPRLARAAHGAQPLIILDGFDELLQASGVGHTDYLTRVAAFQRREADQGRPVAVIVTTRTSVAGRAWAPEESVAVRLEPFDRGRVAAWLATWGRANAGYFSAQGLTALSPAAAMAHAELAAQPLLLLMLALYDADANALEQARDGEAALREGQLYERLLRRFARREVVRQHPGAPPEAVEHAVERELRQLAVVAFAMFNRGSQWVDEADLDSDLAALFGTRPSRVGSDLRTPLKAAELLLGRFFFVHRARASLQPSLRRETYEFLHATFGEFLIAWLTWQVLCDVLARETASTLTLGGGPVDDDQLHALLSFDSLTVRAPVVDFLTEFASDLPPDGRQDLADLLLRLFRLATAPEIRVRRFADYLPTRLTQPARYAAYSANLILLIVCVAGEVRASTLFAQRERPVNLWHEHVMLWRSTVFNQAGANSWDSLVDAYAVDRLWDGDVRDVRLRLDDGSFQPPAVDPFWTFGWPPGDARRRRGSWTRGHNYSSVLRRKAHFICMNRDDVMQHALAPLHDVLPETVSTFFSPTGTEAMSAAHALLTALLLPGAAATEEHGKCYQHLLDVIASPSLSVPDRSTCLALLLDRLSTDPEAPTVATLSALYDAAALARDGDAQSMIGPVLRCALAHLPGNRRDLDDLLPRLEPFVEARETATDSEVLLALDLARRLDSRGLPRSVVAPWVWEGLRVDLPSLVEQHRPDLGEWLHRYRRARDLERG